MKIQEALDNIMHAILGRDVRQSIHDGIEQCYKDATGHPDSVAAVVKENQDMMDLLEKTPYTTMEEEEEMVLPVHTINDETIGKDSTWSSEKISGEIPIIPKVGIEYPLYIFSFGKPYSDSQKPTLYYVDFGEFTLVHLVGAFGYSDLAQEGVPYNDTGFALAKLPIGFEPYKEINHRFQASRDETYLLNIRTDGTISFGRYGNAIKVDGEYTQNIPKNPWLTCDLFYICRHETVDIGNIGTIS